MNSLKGTDISVKDNAELIQGIVRLMMKIPQVKQELDVNTHLLDKINTNAERWKKDLESYYEKTSRMPGDDSKDLIIRRVAEMQKCSLSFISCQFANILLLAQKCFGHFF